MKKIGLLSLALVLALGALGVGYAAWTDTITIDGTVNTGSVDLEVVYYSGTEIYKDLCSEEMVTVHWAKDAAGATVWQDGTPPANGLLVASAWAEPGAEDDEVVITFNNTFPCQCLVADFVVHYAGSVPAMVYAEIESGDQWLIDLWDNKDAGVWGALGYPDEEEGFVVTEEIAELPIQMHYCDYAVAVLWLHLPQEDELMNQTGSFTATITAIQWNEEPE